MRFALMIVLALGLAPQRAPPPKIQWKPDFEKALEEAQARNAVIFLTFQRDGDRKGRLQRRATFENQIFVKDAREYLICVVAHRGAAKGEEHTPEEIVNPRSGAVTYRCPLYEGIQCDQHRSLFSRLRGKYSFGDPPATFLLDPQGEILVGHEGFPTQAFHTRNKVKEAQKRLEGRSLTATQYRKILKKLDKADEKIAEERYYYALSDFRKILKMKSLTPPLRERAEKANADLLQIGIDLVKKAQKMHPEDPDGANKILKKVRYEFKGTEAGDRAKQVMEELEADKA